MLRTHSNDDISDIEDIVPEDDFLEIEDYLDLFNLVSDRLRFRLLYRLNQEAAVVDTLADLVDRDDSTVHYHLNQLVEAGLVENQRQSRENQDGYFSYYTVTAKGEEILSYMIEYMQIGAKDYESLNQGEARALQPALSEAIGTVIDSIQGTPAATCYETDERGVVLFEAPEGEPRQIIAIESGGQQNVERVQRKKDVRTRVEEQVNYALNHPGGLTDDDYTPSEDF